MSVLVSKRKETPFEVRDNMLNIWKHLTELSMRGFGKKKRKFPKTPSNFEKWSEESRQKWMTKEQERLERNERWDYIFINNETKVIEDLCRQIVYRVDRANTINPQYLCEWYIQRTTQDEAIGLCNNLKRELNHIADSIPSNKNFLAKITEDIDKEINLIKGWRKSYLDNLKKVLEKEINSRKTVAEKLKFIVCTEDIDSTLNKISKELNIEVTN